MSNDTQERDGPKSEADIPKGGRVFKLPEFKLAGFAMDNAQAGEERVRILTRATLLSDDPFFHHCLRAFAEDVDGKLREAGMPANLAQASNFAILIEPDSSAMLYMDCVEVVIKAIAKRAVEKGEAVWSNDIGDIRRGEIRFPQIRPDQHYILCLRHGWKFLLVYDLTPEVAVDLDELGTSIGFGLRCLMFEQLYECMADDSLVAALVAKGWFPFNEILGAEFEDLGKAFAHDFNIDAAEAALVGKFDEIRIDRMVSHWCRNSLYEARRDLLHEGTRLFTEGRFIPSIKTLITEIEGILRDRHIAVTPGKQGMSKVLATAFSHVPKHGGAETIYFPKQFVEYLHASVFSHFDPDQPTTAATRNTVGHGKAPSASYTATRALQTILVLDQINRFLTLPERNPEPNI